MNKPSAEEAATTLVLRIEKIGLVKFKDMSQAVAVGELIKEALQAFGTFQRVELSDEEIIKQKDIKFGQPTEQVDLSDAFKWLHDKMWKRPHGISEALHYKHLANEYLKTNKDRIDGN